MSKDASMRMQQMENKLRLEAVVTHVKINNTIVISVVMQQFLK